MTGGLSIDEEQSARLSPSSTNGMVGLSDGHAAERGPVVRDAGGEAPVARPDLEKRREVLGSSRPDDDLPPVAACSHGGEYRLVTEARRPSKGEYGPG